MELIKPGTKIDFVGVRHYAIAFSIAANLISLFGIFVWPKPQWGIDFAGGAALQVSFHQPIDMGALRTAMVGLNLGEVMVQRSQILGSKGDNYLIKVERLGLEHKEINVPAGNTDPAPGATAKDAPAKDAKTSPAAGNTVGKADGDTAPPITPAAGSTAAPAAGSTAAKEKEKLQEEKIKKELNPVEKKLNETFGQGSYEILSMDFVGPKVGKDLRNRGFMAVTLAIILLMVYISLRFEFRFGVGTVISLIHDAIFTTGWIVFFHKDFNLTTIAALLTIVGYSVHDTIVVCDRIRENMRRLKRVTLSELINISINETLARSIMTSMTTFIAVLALFLLGGGVVSDFGFTMLIGVIVGTYSSIYIAVPVVLYWEDYRARRRTGAAVGAVK